MKKFFKKRWHSIPVGIGAVVLALVLVAGGALAVLPPTTQTFTQTVTGPSEIILVETISLPNIGVGETSPLLNYGEVEVYVGPEDDGKWLHIAIDPDTATLYAEPMGFQVSFISDGADNPTGVTITMFTVNGVVGLASGCPAPENSLQVIEGTYTFQQLICVTAGPTRGSSAVILTFTIEDTE